MERAVPQHEVDYILAKHALQASLSCDFTPVGNTKLVPSRHIGYGDGFTSTARPASWRLINPAAENVFHAVLSIEFESGIPDTVDVQNIAVRASGDRVQVQAFDVLGGQHLGVIPTRQVLKGHEIEGTAGYLKYGVEHNTDGSFTVAIGCDVTKAKSTIEPHDHGSYLLEPALLLANGN